MTVKNKGRKIRHISDPRTPNPEFSRWSLIFCPIRLFVFGIILFTVVMAWSVPSQAMLVRIKEIAKVQEEASNPLMGYGLVVGLSKTGDKVLSTIQSVVNMLKNFGVNVSVAAASVKNVAAVVVTADLPPFAQSGDRVDCTVSSLGDATSLEGGVLLTTPLLAADNTTYGLGSGPVSIGGFNLTAGGGAKISKNHPLVGRVTDCVLIAKDAPQSAMKADRVLFALHQPDYKTAFYLAQSINKYFGVPLAKALNSSKVEVDIPENYKALKANFISEIEGLQVSPDMKSIVVVNERTGTVIMGGDVKIFPVAIAQGNLTVTVEDTPEVSQPSTPLTLGTTVVTPKNKLTVKEEKKQLTVLKNGNTISDIVKALNSLGVAPRDLIAVLQALKEAGALQAELKIM